jgi:hypothetical protein
LQNGRDSDTSEEGAETVPERAAQETAQFGTERSLDAALNHMDAPEQHRDGTSELQQG